MDNGDLGKALEADLARLGMTQADLAAKLNAAGDGPPITEQAISNWKTRGRIPGRRVLRLLEILGDDSLVSQELLPRADDLGDPPWLDSKPVQVAASRLRRAKSESDARARMEEQGLKEYLPEHLKQYAEVTIGTGPFFYRADYLSPRLLVELKITTPINVLNRAQEGLLQLAAYQKLLGDDPFKTRRRTWLMLVIEGGAYLVDITSPRYLDMTHKAGLLGISVSLCPTVLAAVETIEGLEAPRPTVDKPWPEDLGPGSW